MLAKEATTMSELTPNQEWLLDESDWIAQNQRVIRLTEPLAEHVPEGTILELNGEALRIHGISPNRMGLTVVPWGTVNR